MEINFFFLYFFLFIFVFIYLFSLLFIHFFSSFSSFLLVHFLLHFIFCSFFLQELTRLSDEVAAMRRALPRTKISKAYTFKGTDEKSYSLSDLFRGKSQLIIQHLMFSPTDAEACSSCSFWTDMFDPAVVHLRARDANIVAVSRAPVNKLAEFLKRMGWTHIRWFQCSDEFAQDFGVLFPAEVRKAKRSRYNFEHSWDYCDDAPGVSVFAKEDDGSVSWTYSTYGRGLDILNGAYRLMDILPKGRDEAKGAGMVWLKLHDEYSDDEEKKQD